MFRLSLFNNQPGVHDVDPGGDMADHGQVVGNIQDRGAMFPLQRTKELKNLCLDGDIQGSSGLIGNQELRTAREGHGNHHTLPLSAAQLVGIVLDPLLGYGNTHILEEFKASLMHLVPWKRFVNFNGFSNLVPNGEDRVQGRKGFLEYHGDLFSPDGTKLFFIQVKKIFFVEEDPPSGYLAWWRGDKSQDTEGGDGLAAS